MSLSAMYGKKSGESFSPYITDRLMMRLLHVLLMFAFCTNVFADYLYIANYGSPGDISVLDTTTFLPVAGSPIPFTTGGAQAIAMNPNHTFVYAPNLDVNDLVVLNAIPPVAPIAGSPFPTGLDSPRSVVVSPNGERVYIPGFFSHDIAMLDATTLDPIGPSPYAGTGMNPIGVAIDPTGTFLYVINQVSKTIAKYDAITMAFIMDLVLVNGPLAVAINPSGTRLYVVIGSVSNVVQEVDAASMTSLGTHSTGGTLPSSIVVSPDGTRLYIANTASNNIAVLDATTFAHIGPSPISTGQIGPRGLALNAAGTQLYVVNTSSKTVSEINATTLAVIGSAHSTGSIYDPYAIAIFSTLPPPPPPPPPGMVEPPTNLAGKQSKNDFGSEYELFNIVWWRASISEGVLGYSIFRDGVLIATVNPRTLFYQDHNRPKGVQSTYSVVAFTSHDQSNPVHALVYPLQ